MSVVFANQAETDLDGNLLLGASTILVTDGSVFPTISGTEYYYCTIIATAGAFEIVKVLSRTTNTLTVTRGQDGTAAQDFDDESKVQIRLTAITLGRWQAANVGGYVRSTFSYKDGDEIYIGGGSYDVDGTLAKITSKLTSPAISSGGTDFHYLYIEYSAIPADGVLDAGDVYWSTTEPVKSESKHGQYHDAGSSDRCIFAVYTISDVIVPFSHFGDYVFTHDHITIQTVVERTTSFVASSPYIVPSFANVVQATFFADSAGETNANNFTYRATGDAGFGHFIAGTDESFMEWVYLSKMIVVGTGKTIDVKNSQSATPRLALYQDGWYLPNGM